MSTSRRKQCDGIINLISEGNVHIYLEIQGYASLVIDRLIINK